MGGTFSILMLYWENKATIMAHIRQIPTVSDIAQWKSMITTQVQTDQHVTASSKHQCNYRK